MSGSGRNDGDDQELRSREAVLTEVIERHQGALMAYVVRLTGGDRAWAEDVLQETFIRAWRHTDRLTSAHGSVRGWLARVAHNVVMDGYRAARARPIEVGIEGAVQLPVPDDTDHALDTVVLQHALTALPAEHRAALVETYLHDRTAVEAAAVLGVPVGTVKSRVFYGLRRLRTLVDHAALAS